VEVSAEPPSRRRFLGAVSAGIGGAWLATIWPAVAAAGAHVAKAANGPGRGAFRVLTPAEAEHIDAMAARILPSDDGPGAREAGVTHFIDRALETFAHDQRPMVGRGVAALAQLAAGRHPGSHGFATLPPSAQDDLLRGIETSSLFQFVRWGTIAGFLSNPEYGGNRNKAGWEWLGFEDRFSWQAPFGYYDRGS
jgi:gluconate 2-dehydrogenase gamma chain